jgi:hypothetical protein
MKNKLCIDCKHFRPRQAGTSQLTSVCVSPHLVVVGDGMEGGGGGSDFCWRERAMGDPTQYSFHCGPEAVYFEAKDKR